MYERISVDQARSLIDQEACTVVDIRDAQSYAQAHVPGAIHLDGNAVDAFVDNTNRAQPLILYCYHGNSSQNAAQYFASRDFNRVYSVDGGFEAWRIAL